jgi:hypothetical protein
MVYRVRRIIVKVDGPPHYSRGEYFCLHRLGDDKRRIERNLQEEGIARTEGSLFRRRLLLGLPMVE